MSKPESTIAKAKPGAMAGKLILLASVVFAAAIAYWFFGDQLSLANLAERESDLRAYQADHPILVYTLAFVIYVAVTGLSLPGAAALSLVYGWFFELVPAVILISFASTTGATVAFLLSRYIFRDAFQAKFGKRITAFNDALEREGAFYLFSLRLIPAVPFFVINVVMGLTKVKATTFWWVSQVGMLPGTIAYVFAGYSVPNLTTLAEEGPSIPWQLILAFALLGVLPLVLKKMINVMRRQRGAKDASVESADVVNTKV